MGKRINGTHLPPAVIIQISSFPCFLPLLPASSLHFQSPFLGNMQMSKWIQCFQGKHTFAVNYANSASRRAYHDADPPPPLRIVIIEMKRMEQSDVAKLQINAIKHVSCLFRQHCELAVICVQMARASSTFSF